MTQSGPNNKYLTAADLLEQTLPTLGIREQTIIRAFVLGLRSPDPKAWGRANSNLAHAIAAILKIEI